MVAILRARNSCDLDFKVSLTTSCHLHPHPYDISRDFSPRVRVVVDIQERRKAKEPELVLFAPNSLIHSTKPLYRRRMISHGGRESSMGP